MTDNNTAPQADLSFEDALRQLEDTVTLLERGDISLDEAIKAYETGTALKLHCQKRLEEARLKVEKIDVPSANEAPTTAHAFDPTS